MSGTVVVDHPLFAIHGSNLSYKQVVIYVLCRNVEFHPLLFRQHEKSHYKEFETFNKASTRT